MPLRIGPRDIELQTNIWLLNASRYDSRRFISFMTSVAQPVICG
ncbi:unnamed protein product [Brassica oleracea]